jgi:L-asparagine oxygenase
MTTHTATAVKQNLLRHGWHYQSDFDYSQCLSLATILGLPKGDRRDPRLIRLVSPQPAGAAAKNTLSSRYGMDAFPFHTDTAYWPTPARFLLFHCLNPGAGDRPTLLVDGWTWSLTHLHRRLLCNEVWRTDIRKPFLCTAALESEGRLAFRFDEACMTPITSGAHQVRELVRENIEHSDTLEVRWRTHDLLVLDNHRMLHARGKSSLPDTDRVLARILIAG